jgi:PAS domain S-box-containing protein/putative nucleotidyltransferase with HDIG domain
MIQKSNKPKRKPRSDPPKSRGEKNSILKSAERNPLQNGLQMDKGGFKQFLEAVPDGLVIVNDQGKIQFVNKQVEGMFGYQPEEMLGKPVELLIPDRFSGHKENREAYLRNLRARQMGSGLVLFAARKDQTEFQVEISLSPLKIEEKNYIIAAIRDVTLQKQSEKQLKQSLERYHHMLDNMLEGCQIIDFNWRYIYVNDAAAKQGRRKPEELLLRTMMEVYPGIENTELFTILRRCMAERIPHRMENKFDNSDGSTGWFELSIQPVPEGVFILSIEITERKLAEEKIQKHLVQLTALREIDLTILGSLSLNLTLKVILETVASQLEVDAADIFLLTSDTFMLEYAAGHGFRSPKENQSARLRMGEGLAGKIAMERKPLNIMDMRQYPDPFVRKPLAEVEGFVSYFGVPLIAKGKVTGVLEVFHRSPLDLDAEWLDFLHTLAGQAAIAVDSARLFNDLQSRNSELVLAYETTLEGWSAALDLRDKETEGHTQRVTTMTLELAKVIGATASDLVNIRRGALLHDIGKMGVPDHILLKPDKLTEEEWEKMRMHPVYAYDMLSHIAYLTDALDIPYCHHEKWDGSGYPRGLKGEDIPLAARIFAVVDIYDALTSDRPYRKSWTSEKTLDYIRGLSGAHLDPQVVEAFLSMMQAK